jgi:putative addiction module killer protein
MYEIRHYLAHEEKDVFSEWLRQLRDTTAKIAVTRRVNRLEQGNFGVGAGYRVYYPIAGQAVVLLLCGGDKQRQQADVDLACEYWQDWQKRADNAR